MTPYLILALPRSRTFWLSRYLSYADRHCGHDESRYMRSIDDIKAFYKQANTGTVETNICQFWRLAVDLVPNLKVITIRRPVDEVLQSLEAQGFNLNSDLPRRIRYLDSKLNQVEKRVPGVLSLPYKSLLEETSCARLFEHCLDLPCDPNWFAIMNKMNLQIDMLSLMRYCTAYAPQLDKMAKIVKGYSISTMRSGLQHEIDGITIKEEPVENLIRDGDEAFREHSLAIGESPDYHLKFNRPLYRTLEENGCMQVLIARSNGRIFGYLVAIIMPAATDDVNKRQGIHTLFYADQSFKGLGMKLQRQSVELLKQKNVHEVIFRAGVRGDGDRTGILYKRMGAEDYGQMYRLNIKD